MLEHNPTKEDVKAFLLRFCIELENRNLFLKGVTTDGSPLYPEALAEIFPDAIHQICRFHVLKEILLSGIRTVAKIRQELRNRIPKRLRGRPSNKNQDLNKQVDELENLHSELFEHRYLFVRRKLTESERKTLTRISSTFPELQLLREIMDSVYSLFDRRCKTSTGLAKLKLLRERVHNDSKMSKTLKKLDSPGVEKALNHLDGKHLPSTSNAVERGNQRLRKMQKHVYRIRNYSNFVGRIAMDMLRDSSIPCSYTALNMLHTARTK